jgi:hypothetical protein
MKDFLSIYDNVLSQQQCDYFINYIEELEKNTMIFQADEKSHRIDHKFSNMSHNYDLSAWTWIGEHFFPAIKNCIDNYISTYSILSKGKFLIYDVKAKKIPAGGGFHDWHYESSNLCSASRIFVVQLYLNEIEEGGETEFLYLNKRVQSKAGRLIIFPAGFTHTHRGNPPINQTKYILSSWGLMQE